MSNSGRVSLASLGIREPWAQRCEVNWAKSNPRGLCHAPTEYGETYKQTYNIHMGELAVSQGQALYLQIP